MGLSIFEPVVTSRGSYTKGLRMVRFRSSMSWYIYNSLIVHLGHKLNVIVDGPYGVPR